MKFESAQSLLKNQLHVTDPRAWAFSAGTDFWFVPSTNTALITSGTAGQVLSEFGWLTTSLTHNAGSAADFLTIADTGTSPGIGTDATGDILRSPIIFGTYTHGRQAGDILGYMPTRLVVDVLASFTVASADEGQTAFGLLEDGGTSSVANDHNGAWGSDGTNFRFRDGSLTGWTGALTGPLVDNAVHRWTSVYSGTTVEGFVDGVSFGTLTMQLDEWPSAFFMHALTTNRIFLHSIHIYYR